MPYKRSLGRRHTFCIRTKKRYKRWKVGRGVPVPKSRGPDGPLPLFTRNRRGNVRPVPGFSLWQRSVSSSSRKEVITDVAGLLSLNLRGRSFTVPANGCLATLLLRWLREGSRTVLNRSPQIAWGKPFHQVRGNLRFPLTVTYHGCPCLVWRQTCHGQN